MTNEEFYAANPFCDLVFIHQRTVAESLAMVELLRQKDDVAEYIGQAFGGAISTCHKVSQWAKDACKGNLALYTEIGKRLGHVAVLRAHVMSIIEDKSFSELSIADQHKIAQKLALALVMVESYELATD